MLNLGNNFEGKKNIELEILQTIHLSFNHTRSIKMSQDTPSVRGNRVV